MSYDYALRQINANVVRALSSAQAYQQYAAQMDTSNPNSPIRRYKNQSKIEIKITGYSFPYPDIATIHFYTELQPINASPTTKPTKQYWQATIKFTYSNSPLPSTERINFNPLGFFITNFQLNQEIPKEVEL
jgi:type IV secretory pathway component VirB8